MKPKKKPDINDVKQKLLQANGTPQEKMWKAILARLEGKK